MSLDTTLDIFADIDAMIGEKREFLIRGVFFGRKAVKINISTDTISIPLIVPNAAPQIRSTQPKKAIFNRYLIIIPIILIIIKTPQKIMRKLNIFR